MLTKIKTRAIGLLARLKGHNSSLVSGQLNNSGLENLLSEILGALATTSQKQALNIVEIGTGSGRGSTESLYRAARKAGHGFTIYTYECDRSLFEIASKHWQGVPEVKVINEFFMNSLDIEKQVQDLISPHDREPYLKTFAKYRDASNFFRTEPPSPVDFFFIDTVRYTHLAAIKLAMTYSHKHTRVLMEDDIPDYGETKILKEHTGITAFEPHTVKGCQWPFVLFDIRPAPPPK